MLLRQDMDAAHALHVVLIRRTVQLDGVDGAILCGVHRPGHLFVQQDPIQVVVGQLGKTGAGHVRQLHLSLT